MSQPKPPRSAVEERIASRRSRIKNRLESKTQKDTTTCHPSQELPRFEDGDFENTDFKRVFFDGTELLTNIFAVLMDKERKRRQQAEAKREEIHKEIEIVSNKAKCQLQDSIERWSTNKAKLPLVVYRLMEKERECLEDILQLKEDQISDLRCLLKKTESDYQRNLEDFRRDILRVVDVSQSLLDDLHRISGEDAESLALALQSQSRRESLKDFEEIKEKSLGYIKHRCEQEKKLKQQEIECEKNLAEEEMEWKKQCEDLRKSYQEEVHELAKEMRRIVAFSLINEEKLEYNIQVLKKRQDEWKEAANKQKFKFEKLNRKFVRFKEQLKKIEEESKSEQVGLKGECEHLERDIEALKERTLHCTKMQKKKRMDIHTLGLKEIRCLSSKIYESDKIIHEQILGIPWEGLDVKFLDYPPLETGSLGYKIIERKILSLCCDGMGCLSEEKFLKALKPLCESEACSVEASAIFELFNISAKDDVDELSQHLAKYSISSDSVGIRLTPNQAFQAFNEFFELHQQQNPIPSLHESSNVPVDDVKYWEQYVKFLPKSREALWDAVKDIQKKYFDLLKRRADLLKRRSELSQENNDLELAIKDIYSL